MYSYGHTAIMCVNLYKFTLAVNVMHILKVCEDDILEAACGNFTILFTA